MQQCCVCMTVIPRWMQFTAPINIDQGVRVNCSHNPLVCWIEIPLCTYQFGGMQYSKVQSRFEAIATTKGESSQNPEECADTVENGRVLEAEREVNFIMAAGSIPYDLWRCPIVTASSRSVLPLNARVCVWNMTFVWPLYAYKYI